MVTIPLLDRTVNGEQLKSEIEANGLTNVHVWVADDQINVMFDEAVDPIPPAEQRMDLDEAALADLMSTSAENARAANEAFATQIGIIVDSHVAEATVVLTEDEKLQERLNSQQAQLDSNLTDMLNVYDILINNNLI